MKTPSKWKEEREVLFV